MPETGAGGDQIVMREGDGQEGGRNGRESRGKGAELDRDVVSVDNS